MYGSRTDKARGQRISRSDQHYLTYLRNGRVKGGRDEQDEREAIVEQVTAMLDDAEPAMLPDCESEYDRWAIEELHAEALRMHEKWWEDRLDDPPLDLAPWEAELVIGGVPEGTSVAWSTEINDFDDAVWQERMRLEDEDRRRRDAQYDHAYGGYSDDPDYGDYEGCWLPFMRIEELRDTFGHNWLGNGFHIIDGNGIRRSK